MVETVVETTLPNVFHQPGVVSHPADANVGENVPEASHYEGTYTK